MNYTQSSGYLVFLTDVWRNLAYVTREMSFSPEGPVMAFLFNITINFFFLIKHSIFIDKSFTIRLGTFSISADLNAV